MLASSCKAGFGTSTSALRRPAGACRLPTAALIEAPIARLLRTYARLLSLLLQSHANAAGGLAAWWFAQVRSSF